MYEYERVRRLVYGEEGATFIPMCKTCGRFVKPDETITFRGGAPVWPNAVCSKCGRVGMLFEGYI